MSLLIVMTGNREEKKRRNGAKLQIVEPIISGAETQRRSSDSERTMLGHVSGGDLV